MGKIKELLTNRELLLEIGLNPRNLGFRYWELAIELYELNTRNFKIYKIMNIYKEIADIYKTSFMAVEKAMRESVNNDKEKISKWLLDNYKFNGKITNKTLLTYIIR